MISSRPRPHRPEWQAAFPSGVPGRQRLPRSCFGRNFINSFEGMQRIGSGREQHIQRISLYHKAFAETVMYSDFVEAARARRRLHAYVADKERLPLDLFAIHSHTVEKGSLAAELKRDALSHAALRTVCAVDQARMEGFVSAEQRIFKLRLEAYPEREIFRFFLDHYLPALQEPITCRVEQGGVVIQIDHAGLLNWRGDGEAALNREVIAKIRDRTAPLWKEPAERRASFLSSPLAGDGGRAGAVKILAHFTKAPQALDEAPLASGILELAQKDVAHLLAREFERVLSEKADALVMRTHSASDERLTDAFSLVFGEREHGSVQPLGQSVQAAEKNFPPCIYAMLERLRAEGHLKYQDRLTLGTFLKNIGLTLEQSLKFWRDAFSGVSEDAFNKEYRYGIRHMYGREGKRVEHRGHMCARIISETGTNSCTGCPIKGKNRAIGAYFQDKAIDLEDVFREKDPRVACTWALHSILRRENMAPGGECVSSPTEFYCRAAEAAGPLPAQKRAGLHSAGSGGPL